MVYTPIVDAGKHGVPWSTLFVPWRGGCLALMGLLTALRCGDSDWSRTVDEEKEFSAYSTICPYPRLDAQWRRRWWCDRVDVRIYGYTSAGISASSSISSNPYIQHFGTGKFVPPRIFSEGLRGTVHSRVCARCFTPGLHGRNSCSLAPAAPPQHVPKSVNLTYFLEHPDPRKRPGQPRWQHSGLDDKYCKIKLLDAAAVRFIQLSPLKSSP
jgi:hypothetical protein